ncbi:tetratricopeptide repeat protein [Pleurocapsa sp. FMAR1]|uniref:tetratricopeptide repeat protein n=1 Tax=Pleurocapsa sp. FMAR1 TaxID=3040204 RepID=UPI0029C8E77C|nr:tetratricopeptide repeat protein [Pleurocapsa sp. FMAR1]
MIVLLTRHSNNQPVSLTKQIADSGEGQVWSTNLEGYLAKIYHDPTPARIAKLKVMLANPPAEPMLSHNHVSIAWVSDLLKDSNGKYLGFLMPAIADSKQLSSVYNPRLRKKVAPGFNWYYLHVTALNTAWIIQEIHAKGYVLGDIKLENILVNDRAMTAVIDTDSFQVRDPQSNQVYRCTVGSEGFTPPELLGKDFDTTNQTEICDRFRLGVLIHYLLFGYHPFSGQWTGVGESPEQTELIKQGYWYGGHNSPIRASETTIPLDVVHPELKQLFLKCFNEGHTKPHLRPTALDWHNGLEVAVNQLISCSRVDSHHYSRHYGKCYWCDRAVNLNIDIFPGVANTATIPSQIKQTSPPKVPSKYRKETIAKVHNTQNTKKSLSINDNPHKPKIHKRKLQNIILFIVIAAIPLAINIHQERTSFLQTKAETQAKDYIDRGLAHHNLNEYQEAIDDYTQAIYLNPDDFTSYFKRADIYYYLKEYRQAINDYSQVILLKRSNESVYHNRGKAYYYLEEYQEAIDDYTQAIHINLNYDDAYNNRGLAYVKLGDRRRAISDFRQAARLGNEAAKENLSYY